MKHRKFVSFGEVVSFGGRAMVYSPFIEPPNEISHQMKDSPNGTTSQRMKDPSNGTMF